MAIFRNTEKPKSHCVSGHLLAWFCFSSLHQLEICETRRESEPFALALGFEPSKNIEERLYLFLKVRKRYVHVILSY